MKVTLLSSFNPKVASAGGVRPYVESISRYLQSAGIGCMTIVAGSTRSSEGDCLQIPVRRFGSSAYWLAALFANIGSLPIPSDSIIHGQRPDDLLPFVLSGTGKAWVCTLHGNPSRGIRERGRPFVYGAYAAMEAVVLRIADRIIFVDWANASAYLQRYPWLEGRFDVIPNGVNMDLFKPEDKLGARHKWGFTGTVFLYAGRLEPEKRVPEIVNAFRRLDRPDALLVIAGDGRESPAIAQAAKGLNVQMLGTVPRSEMPSLMNASDALVLYSTREGVPSVALEALACGLPVIATPAGALPDLVIGCKTGFLVTSQTDLTQAMQRICQQELVPAPSISQTVARYSWTELGPTLVRAYSRAEQSAQSHGADRAL